MKSFSITRIPDNDLIGLLFQPLTSFSEYEIEVIHPEYEDGYCYYNTGEKILAPKKSAAVYYFDGKSYTYVLIPIINTGSSAFTSGIIKDPMPVAISSYQYISIKPESAQRGIISGYGLFKIESDDIGVVINSLPNCHAPIIAFRSHRSDNVNPRSPLRPEPIEIRERQESEPDVEETLEEVEEE